MVPPSDPEIEPLRVPRAGFEPAACRLGGDRSIQSELPGPSLDYRVLRRIRAELRNPSPWLNLD